MEWKDIKPLRESEARLIVKKYFIKHGFQVEEIDPSTLKEGKKSPDLIIKKNNKSVCYCEIKTPSLNLNPVTGLYQWNTIFYKLRRFIHTAYKQFFSFDPKHKEPWVIVFTSNHPQLNWTSFTNNVIGAVVFNGKVLKDFRSEKFLPKSNEELLSIDMIVWLQVSYLDRQEVYQVKFFINKDRPLIKEVEALSVALRPKD